MRGFRLGVSRVVWDELFGAARARTVDRLRREYLDTCRLFGESMSHQEKQLARLWGASVGIAIPANRSAAWRYSSTPGFRQSQGPVSSGRWGQK